MAEVVKDRPGRLNYLQAVELMKDGRHMRRHGWNGKDIYVCMVGNGLNIMGNLPNVAHFRQMPYGAVLQPFFVLVEHAGSGEGKATAWSPSMPDSLATDWCSA